MFQRIGQFTARYRWPIIAAWVTLTIVITLAAPNLDDVASSDTADFLPTNAPFNDGFAKVEELFPNAESSGSAVIAVEVEEGSVREGEAWAFITAFTTWLTGPDAPEFMEDVISPSGGLPLMADSLIAPDNQLALLTTGFNTGVLDDDTVILLEEIQAYIDENAPDGVNVYVTGNSPIYSGYANSALESVDRTLVVTIVLVILLLLLIYRSPVSPLIPLMTVTLVYLITRGLVAWMGTSLITVNSYTNVMLIVILYGAGTDYCLFLISRFREEMADADDARKATASTVRHVGETIASSAGTVIVGFVAMSFAEMGLFNSTGPALALGVIVMLAAGLTLTPALLSVLGVRAFWPGKATHKESSSRLYEWLARTVSDRPLVTIILISLVLAPLALYGTGLDTTYNMLADLPDSYDAQIGFKAIETHMGAGQVQTVGVIVDNLAPENALAEVDRWTQDLLAIDGVAEVRSMSDPLGQGNDLMVGITHVSRQFELIAEALSMANEGDGIPTELMTPENIQLAMGLLPVATMLLDDIEALDPALGDDANLQGIRSTFSGLPAAALTGNIDAALAALGEDAAAFATTAAALDLYYFPEALPEQVTALLEEPEIAAILGDEDPLLLLTERYITPDRSAARFEIILSMNPYSDEATNMIRELRTIMPGGAESVSGLPTIMTDLRDTMERDMLRSFSLVLVGIFVVLVLLLRALVAPVYLILTILFSYMATLGITRLFSGIVFGTDKLTWWAPFFIFVMLIALGMDYNIFLMGRVKEETARHGLKEGVHRAVAATGPIITSAGIIMAGTFGAMMASTITGLQQLGFAVAIGVLMDTFIIRTALVPAIVVLVDDWNWWPGKAPSEE